MASSHGEYVLTNEEEQKMKKSVLALLLAVIMTASLLTVGAFAEGETCVGGEGCTHIAAIGDTHYNTLVEAVDAAGSAETTIKLLKSTEGSGVVVEGKNIIFDLNNCTYTVVNPTVGSPGTETNGFQLKKGSTVTFKNGTIKPGTSAAKILIQNYCDLTLDNVVVDCSDSSCQYVASNNCGNVVIRDSELTAPEGQVAFDVYYWTGGGYATGVSVTVEGNSVITGKIEYGGDSTTSNTNVAEYAKLNITDGTFKGELDLGIIGSSGKAGITVTGGTFISSTGDKWDMSDYVQPGMTQDASGSVVIDTDTAVASIGSVGYDTLSAALIDAKDGETVKLLANIEENITVSAGQDIILDLNGFNITNVGSSNTITVKLGAKLEIIGNGIVDNTEHGKAAVWNNGTVTLSGGTYTRSKENGQNSESSGGNSYYNIVNHGIMTINSGAEVHQSGAFSSMVENGYYSYNSNNETSGYVSGKNHEYPSLTINGGVFSGGLNTIKNDDGAILTINDGSFENVTQTAVMNWNKATINGGKFVVTGTNGNAVVNSYAGDGIDVGSLEINGGEFYCEGPLVGIGKDVTDGGNIVITNGKFDFTGDLLISTSEADVAVSGGDFSVSVSDYVAEGFEYELENGSGRFSYYKTYAEALEAADNGSTISKISEDGSLSTNYTVKLVYGNGEVNFVQTLPAGSEFILPDVSNSGYIFLGWRNGNVTYKAGDAVTVNSDMTFTAVWGNLPDVDPEEPTEPEVPDFPFYDVNVRDWYYDAVYYVWEKGLMDGVDTHEFAPNATLTRAMVWTIIARAEGVDTTGGASWYAKAQEWVVAKGISDGENPSAAITRQELVTMLYRLAGEPSVSGTITAPDAASVSAWAGDAMVWAMNIGLIEGDENGAVTPTATATRAQAAAIFMRYIEA